MDDLQEQSGVYRDESGIRRERSIDNLFPEESELPEAARNPPRNRPGKRDHWFNMHLEKRPIRQRSSYE